MILEQVKLLLNINDDSKDSLLNTLITLKSSKLSAALGSDAIPEQLGYIVVELVINHYNKLGSEGLEAESVEGISKTYSNNANELAPYADDIRRHVNATTGKFRFI